MTGRRATKATKKKKPAKASRKAAKAKKRTSRKPDKTKKAVAANEPLELVIKDDALKYKLQAAMLLFIREDTRLNTELQAKIDTLVTRTRRNDPKWGKANKMRTDAINELIKLYTPELPAGYMVKSVNPEKGSYVAVYNPDERGQLIK